MRVGWGIGGWEHARADFSCEGRHMGGEGQGIRGKGLGVSSRKDGVGNSFPTPLKGARMNSRVQLHKRDACATSLSALTSYPYPLIPSAIIFPMRKGPQTSVIFCGDYTRTFTTTHLRTVKQLLDRDFRKELKYVRMNGG
jgi:hypothetical protein